MYGKPKIQDYGDLAELTACGGGPPILEDFSAGGELVFDPILDVTVCITAL